MTRKPLAAVLVLYGAAVGAMAAAGAAPAERDPTLPPPGLQATARSADANGAAPMTEVTPRHMMVIDGQRFLIVGGRRLAVGDALGNARIERLDDSSVWLREGGALRQVSLFGGIVKRPVPAVVAASAPGASRGARKAASATTASSSSSNSPNR